jgi:hypothetical protein
LLSACGTDYEWRQKVTIEARADGKTYRGSSVTQVVVHHRGFDMSGIPHPSDHYGEAPLVDMGEHGVIIVALRDLDEGLAISTFQPELGDAFPERIRADDVFRESLRLLQSA